jgi:hypothetical protein
VGNRRSQRIPERQSTLVPTTSNWYPCFDAEGGPAKSGGHVRVTLTELPLKRGGWNDVPGAGGWRVCAWGADDFGMELDFEPGKRMDALALYKLVTGAGAVTTEDLEELGFKRA